MELGAVVGFDREGVDASHVFDESGGDSAAVGRVSEVGFGAVLVVDDEAEARDPKRVVGEDFGVHADIGGEFVRFVEGFGVGAEEPHSLSASHVSAMDHEFGAEVSWTDRADPSGVAVIGVEVGVDDRVDFVGTDASLAEEFGGSSGAESGIDEVHPAWSVRGCGDNQD